MSSLIAWWRTRMMRVRVFGLLILLAGAVIVAGAFGSGTLWVLLLVSLVTSMRLWDDLIDAAHDRCQSPGRVIAMAANTHHFWSAFVVLTGFSLVLTGLFYGGARLLTGVAIYAWLFVIYRYAANRRTLRNFLILSKYPLIVLMLSAVPFGAGALLAAFVTYLSVLLFDSIDWDVLSV